jgi:hypothetical protein
MAGFGFLLLWSAVLTAIVRNFSGALWYRRLVGTLSTEPVLPAAFSRRHESFSRPTLCRPVRP